MRQYSIKPLFFLFIQTIIESSKPENSLLDGDYDEKEAAQSFQQALAEWRKENTDPKPKSPAPSSARNVNRVSGRKPTQLGTKQPTAPVASPVHTPSELCAIIGIYKGRWG